jgi:hypothetical protein
MSTSSHLPAGLADHKLSSTTSSYTHHDTHNHNHSRDHNNDNVRDNSDSDSTDKNDSSSSDMNKNTLAELSTEKHPHVDSNSSSSTSVQQQGATGHGWDGDNYKSVFGVDYVDPVTGEVHELEALGGALGAYGLFVAPFVRFFKHPMQHKPQWLLFVAFAICETVMGSTGVPAKWHWFSLYAFLLLSISPFVRDPTGFFSGGLTSKAKKEYSVLFLFSASFVAWLFAKSIQNSASLSYSFGVLGGICYAGYYVGMYLYHSNVLYRTV